MNSIIVGENRTRPHYRVTDSLTGGISLAPEDKQHKKRLKEAQKTYTKYLKAFQQGKITKDELKEKLRPYKYELKELGFPVKIKDEEEKTSDTPGKEETSKEPDRVPVAYKPWKKRSSLTIEEIERRVDTLSPGRSTSEKLKKLYETRFGEELAPPEDLIPFERAESELPQGKPRGALPAAGETEEGTEEVSPGGRRSLLKSLFKGSKEAKPQ
jgi:hypothetical protein